MTPTNLAVCLAPTILAPNAGNEPAAMMAALKNSGLDTKAVTYMLTHDRIVEALSSVRYTPAVKVPLFRGRSVRGHVHDVLYGLFMQHALDGEFLTMEEFRKAVYELGLVWSYELEDTYDSMATGMPGVDLASFENWCVRSSLVTSYAQAQIL